MRTLQKKATSGYKILQLKGGVYMKFDSKLYKELALRVDRAELAGVNRLIERGHYGVAEKHGVHKLFTYVRALEKQLGIELPEAHKVVDNGQFLKINQGNRSFYQLR